MGIKIFGGQLIGVGFIRYPKYCEPGIQEMEFESHGVNPGALPGGLIRVDICGNPLLRTEVSMTIEQIEGLLGKDRVLLDYQGKGISKEQLHVPGPDFIERVPVPSDRPGLPVARHSRNRCTKE
jgi:hypothetical protein